MATAERRSFFFLLFFEEANGIVKSNLHLQGKERKGAGTQAFNVPCCFLHLGTTAVAVLFSGSKAWGVCIVCSRDTQKEPQT